MTFHFGQLIAHIAKTRNVRAGSIVGSGTVSNKGVTGCKTGRRSGPRATAASPKMARHRNHPGRQAQHRSSS
jgi:2-keto-4-pentenoate hydratase/2-oxohepta-3-ene-1,7-dioic acid hydratase in catechol pathway